MKSLQIQRKFVKPGQISQYLNCPICLDVFHDATRLFCGHTFCFQCLKNFMRTGKTCPECRTVIDAGNIGIDLLARQIINQFEVFCPAQSCPWKGILQELDKHVVTECKFSKQAQKNKNYKYNKKTGLKIIDAKIMDTINEHAVKGSLEARILARTDSTKQSLPVVEDSESNKNSKQTKERSNNKKMGTRKKKPESNFDFLSNLFD